MKGLSGPTVTIKDFIDTFRLPLKPVYVTKSNVLREIQAKGVQRLGLTFLSHFEEEHLRYMQAFGRTEMGYLKSLDQEQREAILSHLVKKKPLCLVFCHDVQPPPFLIEEIKKNDVVALEAPVQTRLFEEEARLWMKEAFSKKKGLHGTLMDVYGVGVLLLGLSGIGKSECALELIERGHRLVADDNVIVTNIDDSFLLGRSSQVLPYHIEIRGIGIVDIKDIYGVKAVRDQKNINLVVSLEEWNKNTAYNRLGVTQTYTVLGVSVPHVILPVRPGRSLSVLIEVACTMSRLKQMGKSSLEAVEDKITQMMNEESFKDE